MQYSPEVVRYMQHVFPWDGGPPASSTQTASRSLQPFSNGLLGDKSLHGQLPTVRYHALQHGDRIVTIDYFDVTLPYAYGYGTI